MLLGHSCIRISTATVRAAPEEWDLYFFPHILTFFSSCTFYRSLPFSRPACRKHGKGQLGFGEWAMKDFFWDTDSRLSAPRAIDSNKTESGGQGNLDYR